MEKLRYSNIVFLADSDVDGGHINTLLTNFFYSFWPELFEEGAIQIAKAPLFEVETDSGVVFLETPSQLEKLKDQKSTKIKAIHRNKGLGEMSPDAWKYVMSRESYTKITVEDKGIARAMLDVCFGKDSNPRKDLLLDQEGEDVSVTRTSPRKAAKKVAKTAKKATKKTAKKATKKTAKKATKKTAKKATKKTAKKATKKTAKKATKKTAKKATKKTAKKATKNDKKD